ncbi:Uncharacterised protein [Serratia rubidaea]|uniref:Uncharacterized protein n=1 Tax=Serratia rubidaea TaxID=61652 RepID=A0A4U9HK36_SERRU|nr:Uncharacterised protein [Serratia rubidaea]
MALAHSLGQRAAYGYADLIETADAERCVRAGPNFSAALNILIK